MNTGGQELALQSELAALESEIAKVRERLAVKQGMKIEHLPAETGKEAMREVLAGKIFGGERSPASVSPAASQVTAVQQSEPVQTTSNTKSYLDLLSAEEISRVNELIQHVSRDGITKTIERAKSEAPFILDAFHDALVDRLYDELIQTGVLKAQ